MELVSPVVEIIKSSSVPLKKHIGYFKHFRENVEDLSERTKDLEERRMYLQSMVNYFLEEEPKNQIDRWIEQAIGMEGKARMIEQKAQAMKRCLFLPNPKFRYSISKQAKREADIIARLRQVGEFEKLTMPSLTPAVIEEAAPSIKGLSSVESTLKKVMVALRDENNRIIGVWGMGGVGKTTVVKNLNNELMGTQDFSKVIVVVVSKEPEIYQVQDDIASRLGLTLRNDSSRARELSSRLKQEKRFLIILDDLWDRLDLDAVGIPSGDSLKNSKIILTTRKENVCKKMETQINIVVDVLQDDESWRLFREKAGNVVDDYAVRETAMKVVGECAGLPLAVITVGRALRDCRDSHVWENALVQLQESTPTDIEDMEAKVYIPIKLSYEFLRAELKPSFLFCCLYPEDYDIEIDRMVRQWMGEGILVYVGDMEKTINKGHSWVVELKSSCLLLEGRREGCVRMHDVVRDVGISISSKDDGYRSLVKTTMGLKRLPPGLKWDEYKRISVMQTKIKEIQERASCSQLLTLMLQENTELEKIDGFLEGENLQVLDLSSTAISQVPTSLSILVNLRVLCLRSCRFLRWDLSSLESLQNLESLDLSDNEGMKELPRVIGELRKLRSLDLTRTPGLYMLEKGILSKLSQLEELKMFQSFNMWGVYSGMASLGEVASLQNLCRLFVESVNAFDNAYFTNVEKLYVRLTPTHPGKKLEPPAANNNLSRHSDRSMEIYGYTGYKEALFALRGVLFKEITGLSFTDCNFALEFPFAMQFKGLKFLSIVKCTKLPYIFGVPDVFKEEESQDITLSNLRYLELQSLPDLRMISPEDCALLPNLTNLHVSFCDELAFLFSYFSLQHMGGLATIEVDCCQSMTTLFEGRLVNQGSGIFHNLQTLILTRLPSMTSIWEVGSVDSLQNLTVLSFSSCKKLRWGVLSCEGLKGGLPNLVELSVVDCDNVTMIISNVTNNHGLLPKLRKLKLDNLPILHTVCDAEAVVWHSLKEIFVRGCYHLTELEPLLHGRKGVPLLEKIEIEKWWWEELHWVGDGSMKSQFQPLFIGR